MLGQHSSGTLLLAAAASLSACAAQGPFPSLAARPEEGLISLAEPVRPPVEAASDAALRGQVATLRERGRAGARAFDAAYPAAERAARNIGNAGSDSWIAAQQAISRLEAARGEASAALTDLDRLSVERADVPTNTGDYAMIGEAMAEIERATAERQGRIDSLRSRLSR